MKKTKFFSEKKSLIKNILEIFLVFLIFILFILVFIVFTLANVLSRVFAVVLPVVTILFLLMSPFELANIGFTNSIFVLLKDIYVILLFPDFNNFSSSNQVINQHILEFLKFLPPSILFFSIGTRFIAENLHFLYKYFIRIMVEVYSFFTTYTIETSKFLSIDKEFFVAIKYRIDNHVKGKNNV